MNKPLLKSLILGCFFVASSSHAFQESKERLVSTEFAKIENVNPTMWLPGNVISRRNAPLSSEQIGRLLWIEDVGKQVEKGQVIATLDKRHLILQLNKQKARIKQQQAEVVYLNKQKSRLSALNQTNNTSLSELEKTTKDLNVAKSEVVALGIQLKEIELNIEKTEIKAPFAGHVSERFATEGELITVGRTLIQLTDTANLDIQVSAPISIVPFISHDSLVMVKWQDKLIELPVRTWSKAGDRQSRTFDVRIKADNLNLLAGTAVTVSLPKQVASQAILVPRDALLLREKETFVLTVNDENNTKKVNVRVGQGVGRWVSVIGEISAGDHVIVRGGERLTPGQKVRIEQRLIARLTK